jgi:hypothetical protein
VDDKTELLEPELVMYEPQADGSMVLVGVDCIIPFAAWKHKSPPTLLGVEFGRNEPLGVHALHIWAQRENPVSPFAPWNPNVSCAFAPTAPRRGELLRPDAARLRGAGSREGTT